MKKSKIIVVSIIALICIAVAVLLIYTCLRNRKKGTFEPIGDSCYYAYQVESATGFKVKKINIFVEGVRVID